MPKKKLKSIHPCDLILKYFRKEGEVSFPFRRRLDSEVLKALAESECLGPEVLDVLAGFICRQRKRGNLKTFVEPLFFSLVPAEPRVSSARILRLIIWSIRINEEFSYLFVFKWILCLLEYSLCSPKDIIPLYEVLLKRLRNVSSKAAPLLLKILIKITTVRQVTKWRVYFLNQVRRYNIFAGELLRYYKVLRPELFSETEFASAEGSHAINRKIYSFKTDDTLTVKFAKKWRMRKRAYALSMIAHDINFVAPHLDFLTLDESVVAQLSTYFSSPSDEANLLNCMQMSDVYERIGYLSIPDRILCILDTPQLYFFLSMREDSNEIRERFSITLHQTLIREFLQSSSLHGANRSKIDYERKSSLLRKIFRLESFFQESIPLVNKFLSEYLSYGWNGSDHFLEVLRLLSLIQITEYEELYDCILSFIQTFFHKNFSSMQKLVALLNIKDLICFWINFEIPRVKVVVKDGHNGSQAKEYFPRANSSGFDVYKALYDLIAFFRSLVDAGFNQYDEKKEFYIHQVLQMYRCISEYLFLKELPIRPDLPLSISYFSIVSTNPLTINNLLDYILTLRTNIIPLCRRIAASSESNALISKLAQSQSDNYDFLNAITKDALAVLSLGKIHLIRGQSLFKQNHWVIEDEKYRKNLNIVGHMAFVRYAEKFVSSYSKEHKIVVEEVVEGLYNKHSLIYQQYLIYLENFFPRVVEFLRSFEIKKTNFFATSHKSMDSLSTSGVSSIEPTSKRAKINKRRRRY